MGALLLVSVFILINRLKKKKLLVSTKNEKENFSKEICTLWTILFTFTVTYFLRGLFNQIYEWQYKMGFLFSILEITFGILFDCVPIMLMLMFHFKNFRELNISGELRMAAGGN